MRLDTTHSITFDEQEEAQRLGFPNVLLLDGECAEIIGGRWHIVRNGEESLANQGMNSALDRLLGFIYRTAAIEATEGDY